MTKSAKDWLVFCPLAIFATFVSAQLVHHFGSVDYGGIKLWVFVPTACFGLKWALIFIRKNPDH